MINIVIISDTHADTIEKLGEALIEKIKAADIVVHAGDADTVDFISELKKISKELYAVRGNCDWGSDLPPKIIFNIENKTIGLSHGTGNYTNVIDRLSYLFSDDNVDMVIFGHTHIPINEDVEGIHFINPGSTSLNRGLRYGTYAELTFKDGDYGCRILAVDEGKG